jgi:endonuclease V-like protein UPF0215 family
MESGEKAIMMETVIAAGYKTIDLDALAERVSLSVLTIVSEELADVIVVGIIKAAGHHPASSW